MDTSEGRPGAVTDEKDARKGLALALACTFCSAFMVVLAKWVQVAVSPISVLFMSQVIAFATLSLFVLAPSRRGRLKRVSLKGWIRLAGLSTLYFFAYWTFFEAIRLLDPTVTSFLMRVETLVTVTLGTWLLRERLGRGEVVGGAILFAGVLVLRYVGGAEISLGFFVALASAVLWGVSEATGKVVVREVTPLLFTWARALLLGPAFLVAAWRLEGGVTWPERTDHWVGIVALSLIGPVLGRYLYMKSLTLIPVSRAALVTQIQSVWVAVLAGLLLGVLPSMREWAGGILIIAGSVVLIRSRR